MFRIIIKQNRTWEYIATKSGKNKNKSGNRGIGGSQIQGEAEINYKGISKVYP